MIKYKDAPTQFRDRADEDMKKINAAYDILGDPEKSAKCRIYQGDEDHPRIIGSF